MGMNSHKMLPSDRGLALVCIGGRIGKNKKNAGKIRVAPARKQARKSPKPCQFPFI
jgi:hypothetical protein